MNCLHGTLKPLHCACMVADADCVELLLQKGAEVSAEPRAAPPEGPFGRRGWAGGGPQRWGLRFEPLGLCNLMGEQTLTR